MAISPPERASALRFIVALGIVSLFADMTYEGAYSIIGPFLRELGANAAQVGLISGLGEMLAASLRFFSGRLADRTRSYWMIAIFGYFVNLVVVPSMALARTWEMAALLVAVERAGKALRGPARDVLLSEATGKIGHGWGFGVHAAMDQTGAVLGPLLMVAAIARTQHFAPAFLRLAFPAAGALIALLVARAIYPKAGSIAPRKVVNQTLPKVFTFYVIAAALLACGFVDFPLLAYRFQKNSLVEPAMIPLLYAGAMATNGIAALAFGKLFDHYGIRALTLGIAASLLAIPLGFLGGRGCAIASVLCWGVGLGAQDACLRSGIAQVVSMNKRGSAFGIFNGAYGVLWFLGSVAMGFLYDRWAVLLVVFGVTFQLAAACLFWRLKRPLATAATAHNT